MKKSIDFKLYTILIVCIITITTSAQVGINTQDPEGALDINSSTQGLVLPTTNNVSTIVNPQGGSVAPGTLIYDDANDQQCIKVALNDGTFSNCIDGATGTGAAEFLGVNCFNGSNSTGTLTEGESATGVTKTIRVNANVAGVYIIVAESNGVTFFATGNIAENQLNTAVDITLEAFGVPTTSGNTTFTVSLPATASCTFTLPIDAATGTGTVIGEASALNCLNSSPLTGLTEGIDASGVTKTIRIRPSVAGPYTIASQANGVTFFATGELTQAQVDTGNTVDIALEAFGVPTTSGNTLFTVSFPGIADCTFDATIGANTGGGGGTGTPNPQLAGVTLSFPPVNFIVSVLDQNYTTDLRAGNIADPAVARLGDTTGPDTRINVQGRLGTNNANGPTYWDLDLTVSYSNAGTSSVSLPATLYTSTIPAAMIENSTSDVTVTLRYNTQTLQPGSGTFTARIYAATNLNILRLDIEDGLGADNQGISLLTSLFTPVVDEYGNTQNVDLRDIPGVPDRNFGTSNARCTYDFLYLVERDAVGKLWLKQNLGALYSKLTNFGVAANRGNNTAFNPNSSAKDYRAYGSSFQWGRYSDGHECADWFNNTDQPRDRSLGVSPASDQTRFPYYTRNTFLAPTSGGSHLTSIVSQSWTISTADFLWSERYSPRGLQYENNPCPIGFRPPTRVELDDSNLDFALAGRRNVLNSNRIDVGWSLVNIGYHVWSSTVRNVTVDLLGNPANQNNGNVIYYGAANQENNAYAAGRGFDRKANGGQVRCIQM